MHRRPRNTSTAIVRNMLYTTFSGNIHTVRGLANEANTIIEYENKTGASVHKTGLRICKEHNVLAASTDGIVTSKDKEQGLLEIKNFLQNNNYTINQAVDNIKSFCLHKTKDGLQLNRNNNIYYQIQGQLNIFEFEWCDFVLRRTNPYDMYIERIYRDKLLWDNVMVPKLKKFYTVFLLPELAVPRYGTYTGIREPESPWVKLVLNEILQKIGICLI